MKRFIYAVAAIATVSWAVPTVQCRVACFAIGTPGHSWQLVAQGRTPAAHKGMVHAAKAMGAEAMAILLTGMGSDGAAGMLKMRDAGSLTIAQDEASSVVFGMPREAIALGAAAMIAPLARMPEIIIANTAEPPGGLAARTTGSLQANS